MTRLSTPSNALPRLALPLATTLLAVALTLLAGCDASEEEGACRATNWPVPGTSYSEDKAYGATRAECDAFCASIAGRSDWGNCSYDPTGYGIDGDVPTGLAAEKVCAMYRSIACDGAADAFEPYCDLYCTDQPGTSDYDPGLGCITKWEGPYVEAPNCDEALALLAAQ